MSDNAPGPGKMWVTLEVDEDSPGEFQRMSGGPNGLFIDGMRVVRLVKGPENPDQKRARLFFEAAQLIREGTTLAAGPGDPRLRLGFIKIAEALEAE